MFPVYVVPAAVYSNFAANTEDRLSPVPSIVADVVIKCGLLAATTVVPLRIAAACAVLSPALHAELLVNVLVTVVVVGNPMNGAHTVYVMENVTVSPSVMSEAGVKCTCGSRSVSDT